MRSDLITIKAIDCPARDSIIFEVSNMLTRQQLYSVELGRITEQEALLQIFTVIDSPRIVNELRNKLTPAPIIIDLKDFKGLPIESAPKDGTRILVRAGQGGWIEAYWDDDILDKLGNVGGDWAVDHHCEWHSRLDPDLWVPRPGGRA